MPEKEWGVRKTYEQKRETERIKLGNHLKHHSGIEAAGLRVISGGRAGKGRKDYISAGKIFAYDLSNWKWVKATDGQDFECIVSLNMPDMDPNSGNTHALFDRIGLIVSYHKGSFFYETKIYTPIDLPLNDDEKEKIAQLVLEQYEMYKQT